MAELNLLPSKCFEITLESKDVIKGKFSLWAIKRYCDRKELSMSDFAEKFSAEGIAKLSFDDVTLLILTSVEYQSRKDKKGFAFSDIDACEWIEEIGGYGSENFNKLFSHFGSDVEIEDDGEKKS